MIKSIIAESGGRKAILMDSISNVDAGDAGHIVISASHGGASSGEFASRHRLAAAVSHTSARIGDAEDTWQHGVLSHLNPAAVSYGLRLDERIQDAVGRLLKSL
jgi:hypothetical protein